jgi:ubiquinone/menaquinone biosynthesis C-methylase UbiE
MNAVATSLINGFINRLLAIEPLAKPIKRRAKNTIVDRAESMGIRWRDEVKALQARAGEASEPASSSDRNGSGVNPIWEEELRAIANPNITYPDYYTTSFHAYSEGNLGWLPAMEVSVAARAVHARIWPNEDPRSGIAGDASLRESYHQALKEALPSTPQRIVDLGASAGISTFPLQATFPTAQLIGVELSPYFLAVARHAQAQFQTDQSQIVHQTAQSQTAQSQTTQADSPPIQWVHAPAEDTGLPANSVDLVSACLMFHELPLSAAQAVIAEAYRLLKPGGHFAIMDMNPQCETFRKMPPYVLTLLKSTEPYLDQYFALNMSEAFQAVGFSAPQCSLNSPRHCTVIGQKPF